MTRRHRCSKHRILIELGERCPKCMLEEAQKENEQLKKSLEVYGDPVAVKIHYRARPLLGKVIGILALPRSLGDRGRLRDLDTVNIGSAGGHEGRFDYILPRKIAEKACEIADDINEAYEKLFDEAFRAGLTRVETGVDVIIDHLRHLFLKEILGDSEEARKMAESWHQDGAFRRALTDGVNKQLEKEASPEMDELWGDNDDGS